MDIRNLDLGKQFAQIIIPFHAFPELTSPDDQQRALERIHAHLEDDGRFICTLHNPKVRLKAADGQLRFAGKFPIEQGHVFIWLLQIYKPETALVEVMEFFEEYDERGALRAKYWSEVDFHLLEKTPFERLISSAGFEVVALHGDYSYAPFDEETSPAMIWVLQRR